MTKESVGCNLEAKSTISSNDISNISQCAFSLNFGITNEALT